MHNEINQWIEHGCNYQQGVSLYERFGKDNFLKATFKRNTGAFNQDKLFECLSALIEIEPAPKNESVVPPKKVDSEPANEINQQGPALNNEATKADKIEPPALLKLKTQINNTWAELNSLHPYLEIYPEGPQLQELAETIVKLGRKNTELYEQLDYYHDHGELPKIFERPAAPPVMIDLNLVNKREAVRKLLNKAENRIKGVEKPKQKTLDLIATHKKSLADIDKRIAEIKGGGK